MKSSKKATKMDIKEHSIYPASEVFRHFGVNNHDKRTGEKPGTFRTLSVFELSPGPGLFWLIPVGSGEAFQLVALREREEKQP
jgi:hypothetical protein